MFDFFRQGKRKGSASGQPGSGMHFMAKREKQELIHSILLSTADEILICDQECEYAETGKKIKCYKGEMRMYRYFEDSGSKVYDAVNIEELSPEILSGVCAFQYTILGAEGGGGRILMFDENGDSYSVYHTYLSETVENAYETHAYEYINKHLDLEGKIAVPRREWRMEKDDWITVTNGLGWYICCRNDVFNKMPKMSEFDDVEDVMFHFPDYFGE